ncbi:MAG: carboxypeptidase-like regulatory domain-containing protein [Cyclobacteriaceae bacterium]
MKHLSMLIIFLTILLQAKVARSEDQLTQTIKGQVIDKNLQMPLPGASIVVAHLEPLTGTVSDQNGYFTLKNIPVGRVTLEISFVGYQTAILPNLLLSSGKELQLMIGLEEQIYTADEIIVRATDEKGEVLNDMATVSARSFSIEESQRFAGARNDVSRMATNFAGVQAANDQVNDIVIRGNSPFGLLWRMEGVDIPNPNHFGQTGATGGPVSMLNTNVMANSDFLTGAFPAEYGNAIAGAFDLNLRNGNYDKYEFLGQVGFNGFEAGAEGPISRKNKSSFIANYRYSVLGFMEAIGLNPGTGTGTPYYQDMSFKVNVPIKNVGNFSAFGMGGISRIDFINSKKAEDEVDFYTDGMDDIYYQVRTGVAGISQTFNINKNTFAKATLAVTHMQNTTEVDSVLYENENNGPVTGIFRNYYGQNFINNKVFGSAYLQKRLGSRNSLKLGFMYQNMSFSLIDSAYNRLESAYFNYANSEGTTTLLQPYAQWQHKFSQKLMLNAGFMLQHLELNGSTSYEPRLGLKYQLQPNATISAAYGLHSQMVPLQTYFRASRDDQGNYFIPNKDLDFIKSHHLVLAYDKSLGNLWRIKAEVYYQSIFDAPVDVSPSSFSLLNAGSFSSVATDSLTNAGTGRNYGLELTLEKFLGQGYYMLMTTSFFDAKYTGSDGVLRSSAFDGGYVMNLLGGKEWKLNAKPGKQNIRKILIDGRISTAGGQRYTPVNVEASIENNATVFIEEQAFSEKFADYFRADLRVAYRIDTRRYAHEWALDIQNLSNHQNPFGMTFNRRAGEVITQNQLGIFPMVQYRIEF